MKLKKKSLLLSLVSLGWWLENIEGSTYKLMMSLHRCCMDEYPDIAGGPRTEFCIYQEAGCSKCIGFSVEKIEAEHRRGRWQIKSKEVIFRI